MCSQLALSTYIKQAYKGSAQELSTLIKRLALALLIALPLLLLLFLLLLLMFLLKLLLLVLLRVVEAKADCKCTRWNTVLYAKYAAR